MVSNDGALEKDIWIYKYLDFKTIPWRSPGYWRSMDFRLEIRYKRQLDIEPYPLNGLRQSIDQ